MKYLATVCLFVLAMITQINAQHPVKALSGNQMLVDCVPKNGVARYYLCLGYALGLAEGFMTGISTGRKYSRSSFEPCLPETAITQQLVDVGLDYIRKHPEKRHFDAGDLLLFAWSEAWPCKEEDKKVGTD
jgi:Rap1a immunity proteins